MSTVLNLYTIYCRPKDYPHDYVLRRFEVTGNGDPRPTEDVQFGRSLDEIRLFVPEGLACFPRSVGDDKFIVETWF